MTENEIIQILKDNKEKGIAFGFLPDEVIQFALKHKENLKFHDSEGFWIDTECQHKEGYEISIHEIVCLTEDFELKKKSEGECVEFEISHQGSFFLQYKNKYGSDCSYHFHWSQWEEFLSYCWNYDLPYNAFGGWLYDKTGDWVLSPQVGLIDDSGRAPFILNSYTYRYEKERIIPVFPIKIRFWRISK